MQTGLLEDHVLSKALEWNIKAITLYSVSLFWLSTTICCDSNYYCIVNIFCNKICNMVILNSVVLKFLAKLPCDITPTKLPVLPAICFRYENRSRQQQRPRQSLLPACLWSWHKFDFAGMPPVKTCDLSWAGSVISSYVGIVSQAVLVGMS